jgi:hypothetical protein
MELNKDSFLELSKLLESKSTIKDQFLNNIIELTNIDGKYQYASYSSADPIIELIVDLNNKQYYILDNLHSMFIQNEIDILKNTYKTIEYILSKIPIEHIEEYNLEKAKNISKNPFKVKIEPKIVVNSKGEKVESFIFSNYYEKAIRLIEIKEKLESYINTIENKNPTPERKGLTDHQTALFFHYIFKSLDVQSKTDKTKMAGIVLRLIGKEVDSNKVKDHNIYKMLSNPIGFYQSNKDIESKTLQSNLAIIKDMFITLGIDTKEIQKDINSK